MNPLNDFFLDEPIIGAIRNDTELEQILHSNLRIVFVLYGNLLTLADISSQLHAHNKLFFIHLDRIEGLKQDAEGIAFIKHITQPTGVISTKVSSLKHASNLKLHTILRIFILDSLSIESALKTLHTFQPDAIEILPGLIPKTVASFSQLTPLPIISGGLIETAKEANMMLASGALSVSTSCSLLWD